VKTLELRNDWVIPVQGDNEYDIDLELYELREWWCRPRQITRQLELPLEEPKQPRQYFPF
jgi:hypothetical protein